MSSAGSPSSASPFGRSLRCVQRTLAIAGNTVREAVRSRLLYTLLAFAILMICAGVLLSSLSYVES